MHITFGNITVDQYKKEEIIKYSVYYGYETIVFIFVSFPRLTSMVRKKLVKYYVWVFALFYI